MAAAPVPELCCQECSKKYCVTTIRPLKGCIPLSLPCKHTMCDMCIKCKLKANEQLKCKLCYHHVKLDPEETKELLLQDNIYKKFSVNFFVIGELTYELSQNSKKPDSADHPNPYIDLKAIIEKSGCFQSCCECKEMTSYKCVTCGQVYCDKCFVKVHNAFESLKKHTKVTIGFEKKTTACSVHESQDADFYCDTCKKPICMSCLVVGEKECATHKIDRFHDKNLANIDYFRKALDHADEIFRRLTKTSVDIGNKLDAMYNSGDTSEDTSEIATAIRQHYAKLHACLQEQERGKLTVVKAMSETDKQSLETAKNEVEKSISVVKSVVDKMNYFINNIHVKVNVSDLVEEMEETVKNTAWFLHKMDQPENAQSFQLNAEVFKILEEHLTLTEDMNRGYTLLPTKEITSELPPAPAKPVFPPEIVIMDVRLKDKKPENVQENKVEVELPKPKPQVDNGPFVKPKRNKDYVAPPKVKQLQNHMYSFTPATRSISGSLSSVNSADSGPMVRLMKNNCYDDVPPALEESKTLFIDSTEMVFVEHINDPGDFYVHRMCMQSKLRDLKSEFAAASTFPKPSALQIVEGNLYLGLNKIANKFQRCRVISIQRDNTGTASYRVFFIDHGPTEVITINELRQLPLSFTLLGALALHCQLGNVRPVGDAWDEHDAMLMFRIVNNKKVILRVRRSLGATALGLAVECDLTTHEDGVNVAQALVFHEQAKFLDPDYKYERVANTEPKLIYNPEMERNQSEEVVLTCIVSPDKFFIRKYYMESRYEKLSENLYKMYGDFRKNHSGMVYCPEVGMVVAVHSKLDPEDTRRDSGEWRRGVVTALAGKMRVLVTLPDSGHEVTVDWKSLRRLHPKFFDIKALAVECHLSHISPVNKKWSSSAVSALEQYSQHKLTAFVDDAAGKRKSMGVRLYDDSDPNNQICINEEFIKLKYAVNIGALSFALPKPPQPLQDKAPVSKKKFVKQPKAPEVRILKKEPVKGKSPKSENIDVTVDRGPVKLEVKILSNQSPSQLYVSLVSEQENLLNLYEKIHTFYEETPPPPRQEWKPDDRCCALDGKERVWKRATILSVDGGRVKVFYTDFAVVDEVPIGQVLPLVQEFQDFPNGAFKCHLRGIMPAGGSDWPGITCEHLNDLLEQYSRFFITKKGAVKDKSMPVELWVYHVTPGGALEASKGEWRLVNSNLVEQGLALPDRDAEEEAVPEDTLSLLTAATGTVSQWMQLRPTAGSDETTVALLENGIANVEIEPECSEKTKRVKTSFKSWLPAKPITEKEFDCVPTFVDNDGIIHVHDVNSQDMLDIISISVNARYQNSEIEETEWEVNDPCIALYGLDGQFYRGKVVKVFDQTSCCVEFVDYGNLEMCSVENMRRELVTTNIPIQAVKCQLAGITLVGGKRRIQAVDYTHRIIVEKVCRATVSGKENDIYIIDLHLKGQSVNKLLIETQFAINNSTDSSYHSIDTKETADVDSDPDFIVEDESSTPASIANQSMERVDWNKMIEAEEMSRSVTQLLYPEVNIKTDCNGNFKCLVDYINSVTKLHLLVCDYDQSESEKLINLLGEIQEQGSQQPVITDLYPKKPCISLFGNDGIWYRAKTLQQDPDTDKLMVYYIDYGNSAVVGKEQVREIKPQWVEAPPRVVSAKLHKITKNDKTSIDHINVAYNRLLMDEELVATLVHRMEDIVTVELRKEIGGPLVYQELIDEGLIIYDL